jgi:hypothetical protein
MHLNGYKRVGITNNGVIASIIRFFFLAMIGLSGALWMAAIESESAQFRLPRVFMD